MTGYSINISLLSDCLLGSGEGWGSVVDADIVFDSIGLPYFPARRLKGCIRESAKEVIEMMDYAGIKKFSRNIEQDAFGSPGEVKGANVIFNNLLIPDYEDVARWCSWANEEYKSAISPEVIVNSFTSIRQQTAIDDKGIADDKSLRTARVLKAGLEFKGTVLIRQETQEIVDLLAFACANIRYVGTMRNKGYGRISCSLEKGNMNLSEICIEWLEKEVM